MSLNKSQYQSLFTNAFGNDPQTFGVEIDESSPIAVGTVNSHTVKLVIVKNMPIAWMVDDVELIEWSGVLRPNDPARDVNAAALRAKIG